jgi:hypothetical protein
MNRVVAVGGLQVSEAPFSIIGSGDSKREVYVVASESSECVIVLQQCQRSITIAAKS